SISPPPRPTLLPYTTLFRSQGGHLQDALAGQAGTNQHVARHQRAIAGEVPVVVLRVAPVLGGIGVAADDDAVFHLDQHFRQSARSEEHTSELQSRENLVCRL